MFTCFTLHMNNPADVDRERIDQPLNDPKSTWGNDDDDDDDGNDGNDDDDKHQLIFILLFKFTY